MTIWGWALLYNIIKTYGGAEGGGRRGDHGSPYSTHESVFRNPDR